MNRRALANTQSRLPGAGIERAIQNVFGLAFLVMVSFGCFAFMSRGGLVFFPAIPDYLELITPYLATGCVGYMLFVALLGLIYYKVGGQCLVVRDQVQTLGYLFTLFGVVIAFLLFMGGGADGNNGRDGLLQAAGVSVLTSLIGWGAGAYYATFLRGIDGTSAAGQAAAQVDAAAAACLQSIIGFTSRLESEGTAAASRLQAYASSLGEATASATSLHEQSQAEMARLAQLGTQITGHFATVEAQMLSIATSAQLASANLSAAAGEEFVAHVAALKQTVAELKSLGGQAATAAGGFGGAFGEDFKLQVNGLRGSVVAAKAALDAVASSAAAAATIESVAKGMPEIKRGAARIGRAAEMLDQQVKHDLGKKVADLGRSLDEATTTIQGFKRPGARTQRPSGQPWPEPQRRNADPPPLHGAPWEAASIASPAAEATAPVHLVNRGSMTPSGERPETSEPRARRRIPFAWVLQRLRRRKPALAPSPTESLDDDDN